MKEYTQSDTAHGNCWQTAIACLLEVEPDLLPPQVEIEKMREHRALDGWGSYRNVLNGYLLKHHDHAYFEYPVWEAEMLDLLNFLHIFSGPSPRTAALAEAGRPHVHHCVAGTEHGWWDVHPSRAGLLEIERVGILVPVSDRYREKETRNMVKHKDNVGYQLVFGCLCPACPNLQLARARDAAA